MTETVVEAEKHTGSKSKGFVIGGGIFAIVVIAGAMTVQHQITLPDPSTTSAAASKDSFASASSSSIWSSIQTRIIKGT
jgi:hypothetical protein